MRHEQTKCSLVIIALLISAVAPNALGIPTDALIARWSFQGNANDMSGNGNHGVVYGATLTEDRFGNPDSAYQFDGINDYINIGNRVKPPLPITVAAWVRPDTTFTGGAVFQNDYVNSGSDRYGVTLGVDPASGGFFDGTMFEGFSAPSNRRGKSSWDADFDMGTWHHAAAVFVSINDIRLYWDGTDIGGTYHGEGSGVSYSSGDGVLGHWYGTNGVPVYFHGAMDCVLVYNRALTAEEIRDAAKCIIPAPSAILLGVLGIGIVNRLRKRRVL
jgi:hypothetical protein